MKITRRNLVRGAALGAVAMPLFIPSRVWGANNRIRVGQIGCGRIALSHDMPGVIKSGLADYVAVCASMDDEELEDYFISGTPEHALEVADQIREATK